MQVNIIINSTDTSGKKLNTTITYINTTATNESLRQLAYSLNSLTRNSYNQVTKETKEEL